MIERILAAFEPGELRAIIVFLFGASIFLAAIARVERRAWIEERLPNHGHWYRQTGR